MLEGKQQAPERILGVSVSQFSVARYYGGCRYAGQEYHYDVDADSLIRMDIWLSQIKQQRKDHAARKKMQREKWQAAQDGFAF